MTKPLVSMLLPTRGRLKKLDESLASLEDTVSTSSNVEVVLRVDADDTQTLDFLRTNPRTFDMSIIVGPRGNGYADLHLMYDAMCARARGQFLFLWNDDAVMKTANWDLELAKHDDGKLYYLRSKVTDSRGRDSFLFPIVHRSYYDTLGHFSLSPHNDTYLHSVFNRLSDAFRTTEIVIDHRALELLNSNDQTSLEASQCWPMTKADWGSSKVQNGIADDVAKLTELLKQQIPDGV